MKIKEGDKERTQIFEGVVIAFNNSGTVDVQSGTLSLQGSGSSGGASYARESRATVRTGARSGVSCVFHALGQF